MTESYVCAECHWPIFLMQEVARRIDPGFPWMHTHCFEFAYPEVAA